ncbi:MAG TPA: hypothetical protein VHA13_00760, partial [Gammaproteobacteria bacterium]|nr:hypothetical protein [Gammaproteobacteria bacterium]
KFFIDQIQLAPQRALALGIFISGVSSFLSRVYFTFDSAVTAGQILCKRLLKPNPRKILVKNPNKYEVLVLDEDLKNPDELLSKINKSAKSNIIIFTGSCSKIAYFIRDKKLINTESNDDKEKILAVRLNEKQQALIKSAAFQQDKQMLNSLIIQMVEQGEQKLIANENKLNPIPLKEIVTVGINSTVAGAFYAQNMLALAQQTPEQVSHDVDLHLSGMEPVSAGLLAASGLITAGSRYVAINLKHVVEPEDPYEADRREAAKSRINENVKYYLAKNPHSVFSEAYKASDASEKEGPKLNLSSATPA